MDRLEAIDGEAKLLVDGVGRARDGGLLGFEGWLGHKFAEQT